MESAGYRQFFRPGTHCFLELEMRHGFLWSASAHDIRLNSNKRESQEKAQRIKRAIKYSVASSKYSRLIIEHQLG